MDGGDCSVVFVVVVSCRELYMVRKCNVVCDGKEAHFIALTKHSKVPNANVYAGCELVFMLTANECSCHLQLILTMCDVWL